MAKLKAKELIIIAGDTLPPQMDALKAGRSHAQIGQRPFEMGHRAPAVLIDLINGKKVADPLYTGLDECTPAEPRQVPGASSRDRLSSEGARGRPCGVARRRLDGAVDRWHARALRDLQALRRHPGADRRLAVAAARARSSA